MNSRGICWTIIEAALWVDDLLKNEFAQHPLDHPYCCLIYLFARFVILHNTIIENTSTYQFLKSKREYEQRQGWSVSNLQKPFSRCTCHRVGRTCSMQHRIHTTCSPTAAERTAWRRYQNDTSWGSTKHIWRHQKEKPRGYFDIYLVREFRFGFWIFFILGSMCSEKALHDQRYQLEILRDGIFVNKT